MAGQSWLSRAFHRTASPRWFFEGSRAWMIGLYVGGALCILVGSTWGLGFVPPERYQGDSFRILFVHVPAASLAQSIYVALAVAGLVYLVWRMKMADMLIQAAAPIGMIVTAAALATGIVWGMPTWGTGWVWDARTVSTLMLLLLLLLVGVPDLLCLLLLLLAPIGYPLLPIVHVTYWSLLAIAVRLVLPIPITILLSHLLHTSEHCKKKTEKVLN